MGFDVFKNILILFAILFLNIGCFNAPAINESYNFDLVNVINLDKIAKFLNFGYKSVHQDNETFFDDIKSLEAGCSVTINSDLTL